MARSFIGLSSYNLFQKSVEVIAALVVEILATDVSSLFINAITRLARCKAYAPIKVIGDGATKQLLAIPRILLALGAVNRLHRANILRVNLNLLSL